MDTATRESAQGAPQYRDGKPARDRSVMDLFRDLFSELTSLLHIEGQLVRSELSEKVGEAARGAGLVIAGAVLLIPALVILLGAAVAALVDAGFASQWAALIVGGIALIVGLILAFVGMRAVRIANLKPQRTIESLQRDMHVARDHLRTDS
jgi:hypothetical protein